MGLADAVGKVGEAAGTTATSFNLLEKATKKANTEIQNFGSGLSNVLKSFANTKDMIKFEQSLVGIQRNSAKSTKEIRQLEKAFSGISKGSTYSAQQLAKLTAQMSSNMTMATMSNKAWVNLLRTLGKQFPQSMSKVLAMTAQLSNQFPSMVKALKSGNAALVKSASLWAASTLAMEGNWEAFDNILSTITPVDKKLRELNIQQEKNRAIVENAELAWAKMTMKLSTAAQSIDKFLAKNYNLIKVLKGVAIAAGMAASAIGAVATGAVVWQGGKMAAGAVKSKMGGKSAVSGALGGMKGIPVHVTNWPGSAGAGPGAGAGAAAGTAAGAIDLTTFAGRSANRRAWLHRDGGKGFQTLAKGAKARGSTRLAGALSRAGGAAATPVGGGGALSGLARVAGPLALAYGAYQAYSGYQTGGAAGGAHQLFSGTTKRRNEGAMGYAKSMGSGALTGGGIGAMGGPWGAAIGAAIGAIGGGISEYLKKDKGGSKNKEKAKSEKKITEELRKQEVLANRRLRTKAEELKYDKLVLDTKMKIIQADRSAIEGQLGMLNKIGAGWQIIMKNREKLVETDRREVAELEKSLKIIDRMSGLTKEALTSGIKSRTAQLANEKDPAKREILNREIEGMKGLAKGEPLKFKATRAEAEAALANKKAVVEGNINENIKMRAALKNEELDLENRIYAAKLKTMKSLYYDPVSQVKEQIKQTGVLIAQEKNLRAARSGLVAEYYSKVEKINKSSLSANEKTAKIEEERQKLGKQRLAYDVKIAENISEQAESVNYIRRTWMETFTKMSMGADSGTYLMPGASQLSGLQTRGAAFRPWGPTQAGGGAGTYGNIYGGAFGPYQTQAGRKMSEGGMDMNRMADSGARKISTAMTRLVDGIENKIIQKIREQNQGRNR